MSDAALLVPLEFLSNILVRPVTLSLRLFANMFAGHLLLILFSTGGAYLLIHATGSVVLKPAGCWPSHWASRSASSKSSSPSCRPTSSPC